MGVVEVKGIRFGSGIPKICIPIVGKTRKEILSQTSLVLRHIPDMIEWRVDWYKNSLQIDRVLVILKELRELLSDIPLLVTFRTKKEGGEQVITMKQYADLNTKIAASGLCDMIDFEVCSFADGMDSIQLKKVLSRIRETGTKIIASNHDFFGTPPREEIIKRLLFMQEQGADICKIAVMPRCNLDVMELLSATAVMKETYPDMIVITMAMGELGISSRLCGELFGSAVTFGSVGHLSAPGQIKASLLKRVLREIHRVCEPQNIYLIGFMGSGKSTVASYLAENSHLRKMEMDDIIEKREKMSIPEIFQTKGEAYFRSCETKLLKQLQGKDNLVVSCGGGVILRKENVESMKKAGKIILLTSTPETILERVVKNEKRPVLHGKKNLEDVKALMKEREPAYLAAADIIVSADKRSAKDICNEIIKKLQQET